MSLGVVLGLKVLDVGIVVPYKSFEVREYTKAITFAKKTVHRKLKAFKYDDINVHIVMKEMTPSPTGERNIFSFVLLCVAANVKSTFRAARFPVAAAFRLEMISG